MEAWQPGKRRKLPLKCYRKDSQIFQKDLNHSCVTQEDYDQGEKACKGRMWAKSIDLGNVPCWLNERLMLGTLSRKAR
jgi:hypothetical protein